MTHKPDHTITTTRISGVQQLQEWDGHHIYSLGVGYPNAVWKSMVPYSDGGHPFIHAHRMMHASEIVICDDLGDSSSETTVWVITEITEGKARLRLLHTIPAHMDRVSP